MEILRKINVYKPFTSEACAKLLFYLLYQFFPHRGDIKKKNVFDVFLFFKDILRASGDGNL